jgi:uncharacterized protein YutE (UPF0331/DUF86 family)
VSQPRQAQRRRWQRDIVARLEDFPRQYAALENAMATFGEDFELQQFKEAYDTRDDMDAYNRVQSVERAVGRVQNYVAELAESAVKLAQLSAKPESAAASAAERAFSALSEAGVITGALAARLSRGQAARSRIEHAYVQIPAGDVHRAASIVRDGADEFIGPYRAWIEDYLDDGDRARR